MTVSKTCTWTSRVFSFFLPYKCKSLWQLHVPNAGVNRQLTADGKSLIFKRSLADLFEMDAAMGFFEEGKQRSEIIKNIMTLI